MKSSKFIFFYVLLVPMFFGCTRDEEPLPLALFPMTGEVYTDNPVGLTDEFFVSFDPAAGANTNGFGTDDTESFLGTSSIRLGVPSADDPDGGFIGGIFLDRGDGRNLTNYDALTFYAKGSTTATVGQAGFGTDFDENKFATSISNFQLSTEWKQYIVPIPDPSRLVQEKGMFIFSAGSQSTEGQGYKMWIDEIRFEKLGTIAQSRPAILSGEDLVQEGFLEVPYQITSFTQTSNTATGDVVTAITPNYFDFETSNPSVATVDEFGLVTITGTGIVEITASLAGVEAAGSLTLNIAGGFVFAPEPTRDAANVISLFSDAYTNVAVDNYNGFYTPDGQTTQGGFVPIGDEAIITYSELNFVGIEFYGRDGSGVPPVDASQMTHLHVDVQVNETVAAGDFIRLELLNDVGGNQTGYSYTIPSSDLISNGWASLDIPFSSFSGTVATRDALGILIVASDGTVSNVSFDNIYFYAE